MRGASLAECVLALAIFVGLAFALPVLDEQGYVDQTAGESHGPVLTADADDTDGFESDANSDFQSVAVSAEAIEVAANHTRAYPLAALSVAGPQP